ncbi:MAG: tetratricopeptide repeat protein [Flavobacteriales bacterium]|nr:tetratricopeptide repeat protein [Flavobacteriales bacterium]
MRNRLNLKRLVRLHALDRYAYSLYLKEKLKVRFEDSHTQMVFVSDQPFTRKTFREEVAWDEDYDRDDTFFKWAQTNGVPKAETLESIYHWFGSEDPTIESFEGFKARPVVQAKQVRLHSSKYFDYFDSKERKFFDIEDLALYAGAIGVKIRWDLRSSEEDKRLATRILGLVLAVLIPRENTLAKDVALERIGSEVKRARQSGDTTDELSSIEAQIDQYRQANPLSAFRRLKVRVASSVSAPILMAIAGVIIAVGIIALVYYSTTTPIEENREQLPFFGITEPYNPSSPLAAIPSNLDSADYWFNAGKVAEDIRLKITCFSNAIRHRYDFGEAYLYRGESKMILGFYDDAIVDCSSSIVISRNNNPSGYNSRGGVKLLMGDIESAIEDYTVAIHIKPDYVESYFNRAQARYNLAVRIDSAQAKTQVNYSVSGMDDNAKDQPIPIHTDPKHSAILFEKEGFERISDLYEGAISDFSKVLELDSSYKDVYEPMARVKSDLFLKVLRKCFTAPKGFGDNEYTRVKRYISEARLDISFALKLDPTNPRLLSEQARIEEIYDLASDIESDLGFVRE